MGVTIRAYEHAELTPPHERSDACWDSDHVHAFVYEGFEQSLRGLEADRCYVVSGKALDVDNSYGGYNRWRRALCQAAFNIDPDTIWKTPDHARGWPFFELINFADNEGTIGPEACADLAADFADNANRILPKLARDAYDVDEYKRLQAMFEVAAGDGLVQFT